jgi:hypothetical protein
MTPSVRTILAAKIRDRQDFTEDCVFPGAQGPPTMAECCEVNAGIVDFKSGKILGINSRLAGIASGIVVMYGFLTNQKFDRWTAVFLFTTALTSLTGFLFPLTAMTPAIKLGIISLAVLALAIVTRYFMHLTWRTTYVIAACLVLYFNVFVLVVQSFENIPSLKTIAPTQRTAVCNRANRRLTSFCRFDNIRSEKTPHRDMIVLGSC